MNIPTANELRSSLMTVLVSALKATVAANANIDELNKLSGGYEFRRDKVDFSKTFMGILNHFFSDLIIKLSKAYSGDTSIICDIDWSDFHNGRETLYVLRDINDRYLRDCDAVTTILGSMNLEAFIDQLNSLLPKLENAGKQDIALKTSKFLRLGYQRCMPYTQSGRICIEIYSTSHSNSYSYLETLRAFSENLRAIQTETLFEFGDSIQDLIAAIKELSYIKDKIESRTMFGARSPIEILCFKDKYTLRFTAKAFTSISSYLSLYGGTGLSNEAQNVIKSVICDLAA